MKVYKELVVLAVLGIAAVASLVYFATLGNNDMSATVDGVSPRTIEIIKESSSGE